MIWYHGDTSKRSSFNDQKMDRDQDKDPNAMGPGIYWTESKRQAKGYAYPKGHVYTAEIITKKVIKDKTPKPSRKKIEKMILASPDLDMSLSNWGYGDGITSKNEALNMAIEAYINDDSLIDSLVTVYHDFYGRSESNLWAKNMVKIGIDAFEHQLPTVKHLIVYNPKIIKVKKVEPYSKVVDEALELMLSGLNTREVIDSLI